ncbi:MAG: ABC transporter permease [Gammaproteobacteria bacterium]
MNIKPVILWTDALIYILILVAVIFLFWARNKAHLRNAWRQVISRRLVVVALVVLSVYIVIGLLDSVHFQRALPSLPGSDKQYYSTKVESLFDVLISPIGQNYEKTYSAPFALNSFVLETMAEDGGEVTERFYPRLKYAGVGIENSRQRNIDILWRSSKAATYAFLAWAAVVFIFLWLCSLKRKVPLLSLAQRVWRNQTELPLRLFLLAWLVVAVIISVSFNLALEYHIMGTDKVGQDTFYQSLKSIRTGLVIGTLTTLVMLPFAIVLGIMAGYFSKWIDDVIQYIYTTLSSIPGVLLIAASILSLQIFISNHPQTFPTIERQDDMRLLMLCLILGVTSWTSLCRLLRAETLKIREIDYIQAAFALGARHTSIIFRHILPNVMHIVLITLILDFSTLVLAEAVLSYVGIGVAPSTMSWGNMINSARLELAREPVVWWPILAAFSFMFLLVLAANLFADAVRDALDPRSKQLSAMS